MKTKDDRISRHKRPGFHFGFCLPFPGFEEKKQNRCDQNLNPFPLITDFDRAYTILPIKTYFFPIDLKTIGEHFILSNHESIHLSLVDTTLSTYVLLLTNYQYVTLWISMEDQKAISIPSLKEPTGVLLETQRVLDLVDAPMTFIHELMAVTLAQVFIEQGFILWQPALIPQLLMEFLSLQSLAKRQQVATAEELKALLSELHNTLINLQDPLAEKPKEISNLLDRAMEFLIFQSIKEEFPSIELDQELTSVEIKAVIDQIIQSDGDSIGISDIIDSNTLELVSNNPLHGIALDALFKKGGKKRFQDDFYQLVEKIWLPFYEKTFEPFGYNFHQQYERLLKVWRTLVNSLEGQGL